MTKTAAGLFDDTPTITPAAKRRKSERRATTLALAWCLQGKQARVHLDDAVVEDYAAAMTAGAQFPPIVVFKEGKRYWTADGFHRVAAAAIAQWKTIRAIVKKGTERDALLYACGANAEHGLRRTNADKRHAVELLLNDKEWRRWSDHEIARRCGVSSPFVGEVRGSLETLSSDGDERTYRTKHGTVATMNTEAIGGQGDLDVNVHFSSESVEHYTPKEIIDAVSGCLGGIDLDPCSNSHDEANVPAVQHFTQDDDGLDREWYGRVYMNPPYGRDIERWIEKLIQEYHLDHVTEAIALVPARPDTQWFKMLRDYVCCFVEGRLTFIGNDDPAPFPSAVFYLGDDIGKFHHWFRLFGDVWQRIEPPMFAA